MKYFYTVLILMLFSSSLHSTTTESSVKLEIKSIWYENDKWNISYLDIAKDALYPYEKIMVDGQEDRTINAGLSTTPSTRGLSLHNTYDTTRCHQASVVLYDQSDMEVGRSAVFKFGDTSKCDLDTPSTIKLEITSIWYGNDTWYMNYLDVAKDAIYSYEKIMVDDREDRTINAGLSTTPSTRGLSLHKAYDKTRCHKAWVVLYDQSDIEVSRSAIFKFGDMTKCDRLEESVVTETTLIKGKKHIYILKDTIFIDPGYVVKDENGDPLEVLVSGSVDMNTVGSYTLTYSAANLPSEERVVTVVENDSLQGIDITMSEKNNYRMFTLNLYGEEYKEKIKEVRYYLNGRLYKNTHDLYRTQPTIFNTPLGLYEPQYPITECYVLDVVTLLDGGGQDIYANERFMLGDCENKTPNMDTHTYSKYYVSTDGDDTNSGLDENVAFKTIGHAIDVVKENDEILIKGGVYREGEYKLDTSYVTLRRYGDGEVLIKGSVIAEGWEQIAGTNIWKLVNTNALNSKIHYQQVFYDEGKQLQKIGNPNSETWQNSTLSKYYKILESSEMFGMSQGTFYVENAGTQTNPNFNLYVWLPNDKNPNEMRIEVSDKRFLINSSYANHVKYDELTFMHTSAQSDAREAYGYQGGSALRVGDFSIVQNCTFAYTDFVGLLLSSLHPLENTKTIIRDNIFHDNGAVGLSGSSLGGFVIEDNEFYHNAWRGFNPEWHAAAIKMAAEAWGEVKNNYIHDEYAHGIWFDGNRLALKIGMEHITTIHHNYVDGTGVDHNISGLRTLPYKGNNLFLEISSHINAYNNLLNNARDRGIYIGTASNMKIHHNLVVGAKRTLFEFSDQLRGDHFYLMKDGKQIYHYEILNNKLHELDITKLIEEGAEKVYQDAENIIVSDNIFYGTHREDSEYLTDKEKNKYFEVRSVGYGSKNEGNFISNEMDESNTYGHNLFYATDTSIINALTNHNRTMLNDIYHFNQYVDWSYDNDIWQDPLLDMTSSNIREWKLKSGSPAIGSNSVGPF